MLDRVQMTFFITIEYNLTDKQEMNVTQDVYGIQF